MCYIFIWRSIYFVHVQLNKQDPGFTAVVIFVVMILLEISVFSHSGNGDGDLLGTHHEDKVVFCG